MRSSVHFKNKLRLLKPVAELSLIWSSLVGWEASHAIGTAEAIVYPGVFGMLLVGWVLGQHSVVSDLSRIWKAETGVRNLKEWDLLSSKKAYGGQQCCPGNPFGSCWPRELSCCWSFHTAGPGPCGLVGEWPELLCFLTTLREMEAAPSFQEHLVFL